MILDGRISWLKKYNTKINIIQPSPDDYVWLLTRLVDKK